MELCKSVLAFVEDFVKLSLILKVYIDNNE
jgi:hypothetical protein